MPERLDSGMTPHNPTNRGLRKMELERSLNAMKKKGGERTRSKMFGKRVRIWSGEHGAWWRTGGAGYTIKDDEAGVWDFSEAYTMTNTCGPEKKIWYSALPSPPDLDRKE